MKIIKNVGDIKHLSNEKRAEGKKIAFVPTMGGLHLGHLSLIKIARENADFVIVSIFVNPAQFAPHEDFDTYPRNLEADSEMAVSSGADVIYAPNIKEMYPLGYSTYISVGKIGEVFDGEIRPHFFGGVATICTKLFIATRPDLVVFGQKDFQQTLVIKRLVKDLNLDIEILTGSTKRESNGLAMSSRNKKLSAEEKDQSSIVFLALEEAKKAIEAGERRRKIINAIMHKTLREETNIRIDYASSALSDNLETPEEFLAGEEIVLLIAVHLGKTRIIDNALVKIASSLAF